MNQESTNTTPDHCCPERGKPEKSHKTGLLALIVGIGAALLASLCCVGPLLAVVFGISGAVALAGVGKYHTYFLVAAVLLFIGGSVYIWRRQKCCATLDGKKKNFWAPMLVSFAVFGLFTLGINQVLIPYLSAKSGNQPQTAAPVATQLRQVTIAIDGMDCAGCAGTIQAALSKTPGVQRAIVLFDRKQAAVTYEPSITTTEKLIAVIGSTSYKARLLKDALLR